MTDHTRALDLVLGTAWAIDPEALETILSIAQRTNDAPEAVAAKLGKPLENARKVSARERTAIIPVTGPIFRRANLFTEISGATSVEILAQDLQTAAEDPSVERIVLEIDSPGGQATGIAELAAQIRALDKPTIAYVDGMAASAGYWLAAAADQVIAASTALLGSIGVVASYRPEQDGPIKIISSVSPLKQATPDTEEGRAEAQRVVDELATVFVQDVATYRGVTPETVASQFGRGGILVGAAAVVAGMADRVGTFESLFTPAGTAGLKHPRGIPMAYQDQVNTALGLPADASAEQAIGALSALQTQAGPEARDEAFGEGQVAGVNTERERVSAIIAAAADKPHARAIADAAISNGLTADQASAMIAAAPAPSPSTGADTERERAAFRNAWSADAEQQAPTADSATGEPDSADPEASAKAKWDADAKLRAEFGGDFKRYQAFHSAQASGRVKILRG